MTLAFLPLVLAFLLILFTILRALNNMSVDAILVMAVLLLLSGAMISLFERSK